MNAAEMLRQRLIELAAAFALLTGSPCIACRCRA